MSVCRFEALCGLLRSGFTREDDFPVPGTGSLLATYVGLHIAGGHIGMPVLVLLFLCSKHVQRPITVINFCITWIVYSISYSLL